MAAGDSVVSICNIALVELGEDMIVSLTQNKRGAILCNARYNDVRRAVLESFPWNCGKKYARLPADPVAPPFKFGVAYPLPADFIRMVNLPDADQATWEVVGSMLYTDETAPLNTVYIYDLQDPAQMDPLLVQSIGYSLALELANSIVQNEAKYDRVVKKLEGKLQSGRLVNSQQNSPQEWDEDVWLRSRR